MTSPRPQPSEGPAKTFTRVKTGSERAAYWQQPGVAERIRKALADHEAGKTVPFRAPDTE